MSSPVLSEEGTIYVGSYDNKLYALNPDGTKKWSFTTEDVITASPAIDKSGTIYIGSKDGYLYAIGDSTQDEDTTPPTADAGEDKTVEVDEEVTFDASGSSDNVGIISYEWDFDDGTTTAGETVTHKFDEKGTYEVKLTVTDEAGNTDTDTVEITVEQTDGSGNDDIPGFPLMLLLVSSILVAYYIYKEDQIS